MRTTASKTTLCLGMLAAMAEGAYALSQEFPLAGVYVQGRACPVDGPIPTRSRVTITPEEITHGGGVCAIGDKRTEGPTVTVHALCKDKGGKLLSSDVSFTIRDEKTVEMTAQEGAYKAVLNRCREPAER